MHTRKDHSCLNYTRGSFIPEIERLRGVAICLVILSHVFVVTFETNAGSFMLMAVRGTTWIFIFVAGFLFAHLVTGKTFISYLGAKLKYVLLPYIVLTTAILLAGVARDPSIKSDIGTLHLYYLLGYPVASPLWFVPMVVLFFLAFPIYRYLLQTKALLPVLTLLFLLLSVLMGRPSFDSGAVTQFMYFQSAYLMGMLWRTHGGQANEMAQRFLPMAVVVCVAGIAAGGMYSGLIRDAQVFVMLALTGILMVVLKQDSAITRLAEFLAPLSFGMFFIHGTLTDRLEIWLGHAVPPAYALLLGVGVIIGSAGVVLAAKHAFGTRARYVIGS